MEVFCNRVTTHNPIYKGPANHSILQKDANQAHVKAPNSHLFTGHHFCNALILLDFLRACVSAGSACVTVLLPSISGPVLRLAPMQFASPSNKKQAL